LKKWIDARRNHQYFVSKNAEWLAQEISLHIKGIVKRNKTDYEMLCTAGKSSRRKLSFDDSSERHTRRKSNELQNTLCFPELTHGTKMSLKSAGRTDAAEISIEAVETTPTGDLRIRKAWAARTKNVLVLFTLCFLKLI
jgi:hypothetical protein